MPHDAASRRILKISASAASSNRRPIVVAIPEALLKSRCLLDDYFELTVFRLIKYEEFLKEKIFIYVVDLMLR